MAEVACPWFGVVCPGKQGLCKAVFSVNGGQFLIWSQGTGQLFTLACRNRDYTQQKGCCFTFVFDCSRETSGIYQPISESPVHEINWKDSGKKKNTPKNHPKALIKPLSVKFIKERVRTWQPVNSYTGRVILILCPSTLLRRKYRNTMAGVWDWQMWTKI